MRNYTAYIDEYTHRYITLYSPIETIVPFIVKQAIVNDWFDTYGDTYGKRSRKDIRVTVAIDNPEYEDLFDSSPKRYGLHRLLSLVAYNELLDGMPLPTGEENRAKHTLLVKLNTLYKDCVKIARYSELVGYNCSGLIDIAQAINKTIRRIKQDDTIGD